MSAANVFAKESDLSVKVPSFDGVYNTILIRAKKGAIDQPRLVTDENDLLKYFTPEGTVKVGYDMAYYSALAVLQKTNKLWVSRVANNALYGGALVKAADQTVAFTQVDSTSPELPEITFDVADVVNGGTTVTAANVAGGSVDDLNGRTINLVGVGTFVVSSVTGSVLTLDNPIVATVSYTGAGTAAVAASIDYIGFDITGLNDGDAVVDVANMTSGLPADLDGTSLTFIVDGVATSVTVSSVAGSSLTLSAVIPAATADVGTGFLGRPASTFDVTGAADGVDTLTTSNVLPVGVIIDDLNGTTVDFAFGMSDATTQLETSVIASFSGSDITLAVALNNATLPDSITGCNAPYDMGSSTGFTDPTAVVFDDATDVMTLFAADEGEWSKDLRIEIITDPLLIEEPNAQFIVNVYRSSNLNVPVESYAMSRVIGTKDGYNRNIFIDDMLESSALISGISNPDVAETVIPKATDGAEIWFQAGDDGEAVTESDMIAAADLFANKNSYPMTLFLDGGWATNGFQKKLIEICETRTDSMAILSTPISAEMSVDYLNEIVDYRKNILNANTSYGALFSCHVEITDKYNDRKVYVAPDGYAAASINFSAANYEIWYPAAGFKRGKINVNDTLIRFKDGEMDLLYKNGINPIRFYPGKGIAIWGQKTLSTRPSALDRMNVRLLLMVIEPAIAEFLEDYLFDLNTDGIRTMVKVGIDNYMENIKARNGVYEFYTVCDDTNNTGVDMDNHRLNVDLFVKPVQSIEYIYFTTVLTPTSVDFTDAQAAL